MRNDTDSYVYKAPTDDSPMVPAGPAIVAVAVAAFIFGLLVGFSL